MAMKLSWLPVVGIVVFALAVGCSPPAHIAGSTEGRDGQRLTDQPQAVQDTFSAKYGDQAADEWAAEHDADPTVRDDLRTIAGSTWPSLVFVSHVVYMADTTSNLYELWAVAPSVSERKLRSMFVGHAWPVADGTLVHLIGYSEGSPSIEIVSPAVNCATACGTGPTVGMRGYVRPQDIRL
jgi:hypothetical protein